MSDVFLLNHLADSSANNLKIPELRRRLRNHPRPPVVGRRVACPHRTLRRHQRVRLAARRNGHRAKLAIPALLEYTGTRLSDIDVFEINEAFASQVVYGMRRLGLDEAKVNPNSGASS